MQNLECGMQNKILLVSQNSLTLYIGATIYVFIGAYFEERKLLREFGADYEAYRKGTWL